MIAFLDMDDVIADHRESLYRLTGIEHWSQLTLEMQEVYQTENFFYNLKKTPECDKIIKLVLKYFGEYSIITTPQHVCKTSSMQQKLAWIRYKLQYQPRDIIFTDKKYKFAKGNLLIDDFGLNIHSWNSFGGYAIKFKSQSENYDIKILEKNIQNALIKYYNRGG